MARIRIALFWLGFIIHINAVAAIPYKARTMKYNTFLVRFKKAVIMAGIINTPKMIAKVI